MGDFIEDMDIEIEQKDNKIKFLENKTGLPHCKVIEERNRLELGKIKSKTKGDMNMDKLSKSLKNHKNIENEKQ